MKVCFALAYFRVAAPRSIGNPEMANRAERAGRKAKGLNGATRRRIAWFVERMMPMKRTITLLLVVVFTLAAFTSAYAAPSAQSPSARGSSSARKSASLPKGYEPRTDVPDATEPVIEVDNKNARLLVRYKASDGKPYKIKVTYEKQAAKYYVLYAVNADEYFPLSSGNGKYSVSVLRMVADNRAQAIKTETVALNAKDKNAAFLSSNYYVAWEYAKDSTALAKNLNSKKAKGASAADAIYDEIIKTMKYDYDNYGKLSGDYVPDMDTVLKKRMGVCLDTSVLLAGMLRSAGIPTRVCMGTSKAVEGYHAWNEIFIGGQWVVVDATYDAAYVQAGHKVTMAKKASDFKTTNVY